MSDRDIAEITSLRLVVEPYAAELGVEALRGPERPRLLQTIEVLHRATKRNDLPTSIDAHLQFHRPFYDSSGHRILQSLWNGWESKLRLYLTVDHRSYSDPQEIAVEHERLAALVMEGDMDVFRCELARLFQKALRTPAEDGPTRVCPDLLDAG